MKKQLTALLLSALAFIGVGCAKKENALIKERFGQYPAEVLAQSYTAGDYFGKDISLDTFMSKEMQAYNKMSLSLDLGMVSGGELSGDVTVAVTADTEKNALRIDGGGTINGGEPIDASLYLDGGKVTVASDALLGGRAYGVSFNGFDDFIRRFGNSDLAVKVLGVTEDDLRGAFDEIGIDEAYVQDVTDAVKDCLGNAKTVPDTMKERFDGIIRAHSSGVKDDVVTVGGKDYPAYTLEVDVDKTLVKELIRAAGESVTEVYDLENKLLQTIFAPFANINEELYESMEILDAATYQMENAFGGDLDETLESIEIDGTFTSSIGREDGRNLKTVLRGTITDTEYDEVINIDAEMVFVDEPSFRLTMNNKEDDETIEISGTLTKPADKNKDGVIIDLNARYSPDEDAAAVRVEFIRDKKTDEYDLNVYADGELYLNIRGRLSIDRNKTELTVDSIDTNGTKYMQLGLKLAFEKNAAIKVLNDFTDLLSMSAQELTAVTNDIGEKLGQLAA